MGWVSFWADVSSEMAYPVLPLLVVGTLAAPRSVLGLVEGAAVFAVAAVQYWAGRRSDQPGARVPLIRWGYGLPVLGKALVAAAVAWPMVLAGRVVDRAGKGLRNAPRDALIADAVEAGDRGRAFGLHRAMDNAGAFVGVALSAVMLLVLERAGGDTGAVRIVLAVAAVAGLAAFVTTFRLREPEIESVVTHAGGRRPRVPLSSLPRRYWLSLGVLAVFGLANSSDAFLLLRIHETGWKGWVVSMAYGTYMLTAALAAYPAGAASDRLGRWPVLALGWLIYAAVYAGFAFAGPGALWPLLAVYGVSVALTEGIGKAAIADTVPSGQRGTALGLFGLVYGLAIFVGSLGAGWLWDRLGAAWAFGVPGALAVVAAGAALRVATRGESSDHRSA